MKKVLIVTFLRAINYGAVLQAYATNIALKKMKTQPEFLDIADNYPIILNPFKEKGLKTKISIIRENIFSVCRLAKILLKRKRFDDFINQEFKKTKKYLKPEDVMNDPPTSDIYMTGSDQMFNASKRVNPVFYLEFAEKNAKKISYATSMGNSSPAPECEKKFFDNLKQYAHISVREMSTKEFFETKGLNASQHIDPTFLLKKKEWDSLVEDETPIVQGNYILVYELLPHKLTKELIEIIRKETGYKVVNIATKAFNRVEADINLYDVGPLQFLNLFKNAQQVITTSFHGTCFSIIYNKPFYTLIGNKEKRIRTLCELLNLEKCVLDEEIVINEEPIDWDFSNKVVEKERKRALEYLNSCINEE